MAQIALSPLALSAPLSQLLHRVTIPGWLYGALRIARTGVRYIVAHTGVPALVVAAVLVVVGYRILKRSARFTFEVALVAASLAAMTALGWITW